MTTARPKTTKVSKRRSAPDCAIGAALKLPCIQTAADGNRCKVCGFVFSKTGAAKLTEAQEDRRILRLLTDGTLEELEAEAAKLESDIAALDAATTKEAA